MLQECVLVETTLIESNPKRDIEFASRLFFISVLSRSPTQCNRQNVFYRKRGEIKSYNSPLILNNVISFQVRLFCYLNGPRIQRGWCFFPSAVLLSCLPSDENSFLWKFTNWLAANLCSLLLWSVNGGRIAFWQLAIRIQMRIFNLHGIK